MAKAKPAEAWRNRIVGHGDEAPDQLVANPRNWRIHPKHQQDALSGVLDQVGFVQSVIVNQRSGFVVDGHARVALAISKRQPTVPVVYVDLDDDEERLILATLDPLAALAGTDDEQLSALLADLQTSDDALSELLRELAPSEADVAPAGVAATSVYSDDQIIDAAMLHFRSTGFPYRKLPLHVCMQEINKLAVADWDALDGTDLGYHVADTYHPHRFDVAAESMKAPRDAFEDDTDLRKAMRLALENGYAVPAGAFGQMWIVNGTQACANFRPGVACKQYRRYCQPGATVLDTSAGYGGRLVGFMASGIGGRYIGIDPEPRTHAGNERMAAELGFAEAVELHNCPAEDIDPVLLRERCDFAFTSPPYFSKEHYSDDETQSYVRYKTGEAWRSGFLAAMLRLQYTALRPDAFSVVNIEDVTIRDRTYPLVDWCIADARAAGFEYVRTEALSLTRRFGEHQEEGVATEAMLVFQKHA